MIEKLPNERIRVNDDGTHGLHILSLRSKVNEVIDVVNDHASRLGEVEEIVYDGPDDDCCDCADPTPDLSGFSTDQLLAIRERANCLLEERLQDDLDDDDCDCLDDDETLPDCSTCGSNRNAGKPYCPASLNDLNPQQPELTTVDTTDGLFSQFAGFVAQNKGLRFGQAITLFLDYRGLYGKREDGELDDLYYKVTKGPNK